MRRRCRHSRSRSPTGWMEVPMRRGYRRPETHSNYLRLNRLAPNAWPIFRLAARTQRPNGPPTAPNKEIDMNTTELVDRYIASWNETDAGRRRDLVAGVWTENASYVDPLMK